MYQMRSILLAIAICGIFGFNTKAQLNMTELGNLTYGPDLSDIWGYVDTAGNEYALVGVRNALSIVDVTDPGNPNEVLYFSGPSSTWRDIKVFGKYAYITNESDLGLFIVDLSSLPDTAAPSTTYYTGSTYPFSTAHNLYIDENGICYLFGANYSNKSTIILDIATDPMNPIELGVFEGYYLHDGMARGDTLWGGAINNGLMVMISVSDKANPYVYGTHSTPSNFTHNVWISDDGNTAFTTDETSGAYITSYDVTDTANITELGRIRSNPGSGTIVHNTHFMNNYVITSYYRDGTTIHDVTYPYNMIEVGNFDSHASSGDGFDGGWGVYPWLPSGNVIVSDIDNGLFVLGANYVRGCYLEGKVTDAATSFAITNATVSLLTTSITDGTNLTGDYATGIADSGSYQVVYFAPGYISDTLTLTLSPGVLLTQDVQLTSQAFFSFGGQVVEANGGNPIQNATVLIENADFTFNESTDALGNFSIPTFFAGTYSITVGKWNYVTDCSSQAVDSMTGSYVVMLDSGIYDDFALDFGWVVTGNAQDAAWERGTPLETTYNGEPANPATDVSNDCAGKAFVTGNQGTGCCDDDVDDGNTKITSPIFNLLNYSEPYIGYYQWFFNDGGFTARDDSLTISISNGTQEVIVQTVYDTLLATNSSWMYNSFKVSDYITPAFTMQLVVEVSDQAATGHIVEAGLDLFRVFDSVIVGVDETIAHKGSIKAFPNPFGELLNIQYDLAGAAKGSLRIYDLTGRMLEDIRLNQSAGIVRPGKLSEGGMYFVELFREEELVRSLKVVKL